MLNIEKIFEEHAKTWQDCLTLIPKIQMIATRMMSHLKRGGKIIWMGNGGSAADAQHLAAELIGRFKQERKAIASLSLTTDSSVLTCLSNDYDYSVIFARQLEALCSRNDVVVGISTSGNSPNVLQGIAMAKQLGAYTVGLTGHQGGKMVQQVDDCLIVPSNNTARIQEMHILIGHTLCEWLEAAVVADEEFTHHERSEVTLSVGN